MGAIDGRFVHLEHYRGFTKLQSTKGQLTVTNAELDLHAVAERAPSGPGPLLKRAVIHKHTVHVHRSPSGEFLAVVPGLDIVATGADAEDALAEAESEILARQSPSAPLMGMPSPNIAKSP
jgi:hypothetical protein